MSEQSKEARVVLPSTTERLVAQHNSVQAIVTQLGTFSGTLLSAALGESDALKAELVATQKRLEEVEQTLGRYKRERKNLLGPLSDVEFRAIFSGSNLRSSIDSVLTGRATPDLDEG